MATRAEARIRNDIAHLSVLRGDLAYTVKELNHFSTERDIAKAILSSILDQIETAKLKLKEINQEISEKSLGQQERETSLARRESTLAKERDEFNVSIQTKTVEIQNEKQRIETEISGRKDIVKRLDNEIDKLRERFEFLQKETKDASKTLSNIIEESNKILGVMNERETNSSRLLDDIEKRVGEKKKELSIAIIKTAEEVEKIGKPREVIRAERKELDKHWRDYRTMYKRLERIFKKFYPNQEMMI